MALTKTDIAVLIPLIPLFPFIVTWWLPWEKWVSWGKIPKWLMAPYLFYFAFAAWYLHMDWWFIVLMLVCSGVAFVVAIVEYKKRYRRIS